MSPMLPARSGAKAWLQGGQARRRGDASGGYPGCTPPRRRNVEGEGERAPAERTITKADFFEWGLSGRPDSAARRAAVLKALDLPQHMTANALLEFINAVGTRQQLCEILQSFSSGD